MTKPSVPLAESILQHVAQKHGVLDVARPAEDACHHRARRHAITMLLQVGFDARFIARRMNTTPEGVKAELEAIPGEEELPEDDETGRDARRTPTRMLPVEGPAHPCEHEGECLSDLLAAFRPKAPRARSCPPQCDHFQRASRPEHAEYGRGLGSWPHIESGLELEAPVVPAPRPVVRESGTYSRSELMDTARNAPEPPSLYARIKAALTDIFRDEPRLRQFNAMDLDDGSARATMLPPEPDTPGSSRRAG